MDLQVSLPPPVARPDPSPLSSFAPAGLPASPGAAVGQVVFSAQKAEEWSQAGIKVVLVRKVCDEGKEGAVQNAWNDARKDLSADESDGRL